MALFHDKPDGKLIPIAIQLFQKPSDDNPVSFIENHLYSASLNFLYVMV